MLIPFALSIVVAAVAPESLAVRQDTVRFQNGPVALEATLYLPASRTPAPAVVIVHGSGASDRGNPWTSAYATALSKLGIAVLYPDKRGSGKSSGNWRTASFSDLAADTEAAIRVLRARPEIDSMRIGVIGFSQGGYVSSIVAARDPACKFAIVVSGGVATMREQMVDEIFMEAEREGGPLSAEDARAVGQVYEQAFAVVKSGVGWASFTGSVERARARNARVTRALRTMPTDSSHWAVSWLRTTGDFDPLPYWRQVKRPAAFIYGGADTQIRVRASIERLWDAVGTNAANFSVTLLQGNGHALFRDDVNAFLAKWIQNGGAN